jgi:membrane protein
MQVPGFQGVPLRAVARGVGYDLRQGWITDSAAQLAYYVLFAVFPFLFFLVTLTAYLPLWQASRDLLARLAQVMPAQAFRVIQDQLNSLLSRPRPHLLGTGLALALYSASRGTNAFRRALNRAYAVQEHRPWYRTLGLSLALTVVGVLLVLLSVVMLALSGRAGVWLFTHIGMGAAFAQVWAWLRWPITAGVIMLVADLAYYFLPDVQLRFRFLTPGSVLGTGAWLLATWGFTQYVSRFGRYDVTYGSLGGVILLITWIYISGLIFLLGGHLNAVIEQASPGGVSAGPARPSGGPARPGSGAG